MSRRLQFSLRGLLWWMLTVAVICGAMAEVRWARSLPDHPSGWDWAKLLLAILAVLTTAKVYFIIEPPRRP